MRNNKNLHLEGFIEKHEDGVRFKGDYESIANTVANALVGTDSAFEDSYSTNASLYNPKVFFRFYSSADKETLDEVQKKHILQITGALDIYETWYGYSEYTIEGYSVEHFMVGGHDIEKELSSYNGKYVHILIDVKGK